MEEKASNSFICCIRFGFVETWLGTLGIFLEDFQGTFQGFLGVVRVYVLNSEWRKSLDLELHPC